MRSAPANRAYGMLESGSLMRFRDERTLRRFECETGTRVVRISRPFFIEKRNERGFASPRWDSGPYEGAAMLVDVA